MMCGSRVLVDATARVVVAGPRRRFLMVFAVAEAAK
jgi:hypothetical protein